MPTLQELKRRNQELRNKLEAKNEQIKIQKERDKFLKENKALQSYLKHPRRYDFAKSFGEKSLNIGKGIGRVLVKWAQRLEEAERRENQMQRRTSCKKTTKRKSPQRITKNTAKKKMSNSKKR